jgi:hypothetical protein
MSTIDIPKYWTAKEALAVFEFIDEIREHIWSQYDTQIVAAMREERRTNAGLPMGAADFDDETVF